MQGQTEQPATNPATVDSPVQKGSGEKIITFFIIFTIVIGIAALLSTAKSLFFTPPEAGAESVTETVDAPSMSTGQSGTMSLTSFDRTLAKQFMDKDNDGKCDSCGMPVEMCIDTGQLQCNMDPQSTIGVLDSAHIHADWKIYVRGQQIDLADYAHMERMKAGLPVSSFIHVDSGAAAPEKTGNVLHMHATGVPLWIWLDSVDLELPSGMKAYVNEKEIVEYRNYVFNDLDKILLTDGKGEVQPQLNSITNFAGVH